MTDSGLADDTCATLFARGLTAHQAGHLDEAAAQYRIVIARDSGHADALHMLGLVDAQRGDLEAAERLIGKAIGLAPRDAAARFNLGNVLLQRRKLAAALVSYDQALALEPRHAGACCNRGLVLHELGRFAEAIASYEGAIGVAPDDGLAHTNRGNALAELGRFVEALASHDQAVTLAPANAQGWHNRGNVLLHLRRVDAAVESFDRALALDARNPRIWCNRAAALDAGGRFSDALASIERAIAIEPRDIEALITRGNMLIKLGRFEEAVASYDTVLALDARDARAWRNRAIAGLELGRIADAIASFERVVALVPEDAETRRHLALLRLMSGDLERGWAEYEWRWKTREFAPRPFAQPCWSGEANIGGKTILLHGEQGLGDAIQFCRYAALVARLGATVVVEVAPALAPLIATVPGVSKVVPSGSPAPAFDLHCPLLSLPHAFKTTLSSVPAAVPYLSAPGARVAVWRERFARWDSPRIGLIWAGNPQHANDANRSIALEMLRPLIVGSPASVVALQKDLRPGEADWLERHHVPRLEGSLEEIAAAISALDLVISVDTSIAHLAGALGRPVWVLLPFVSDWRWLADRSDSPWYPTARLFRQPRRGDWAAVIAQVRGEVEQLARGAAGSGN